MTDLEKQRQRIMSGKDNMLKAKFLQQSGNQSDAVKYAAEECRIKIASSKFKEALQIKNSFKIKTDNISPSIEKVMQLLIRQNKFELAARIAKQFEMPKDSYLAGRVEAATSRLIPEFEDRLLGDIRSRDRRPSIIGKRMLWLIALWFPIFQAVLEGGLEMYLKDGLSASDHGRFCMF